MMVFLLEEASMGDFLRGYLPQLVPEWAEGIDFRLVIHEGKQDLEKSIPRKLRGWHGSAQFVIVRDNDGADCLAVKRRLVELCQNTGKHSFLVRIVCQELESWYLGDLKAVSQGYAKPSLAARDNRSTYRNPDGVGNAAQEVRRLVPEFQKCDGARRIAPHLNHRSNRSRSFRVLCEGILRMKAEATSV